MISNQILQNTIDGLKTISKTDFCVADVEGKVVVQTFPEPVSNELEISSFAQFSGGQPDREGLSVF